MTKQDLWAGFLALVLLLTLILLPVAAHAAQCHTATVCGYQQVHLPIVRQDLGRDWFVDAELRAAMASLGYAGDEWTMHVNCYLDETADPAAGIIRYSSCTLFVDEATGGNTAVVFWFDTAAGRVAWKYVDGSAGVGG